MGGENCLQGVLYDSLRLDVPQSSFLTFHTFFRQRSSQEPTSLGRRGVHEEKSSQHNECEPSEEYGAKGQELILARKPQYSRGRPRKVRVAGESRTLASSTALAVGDNENICGYTFGCWSCHE